MFNNLITKEYYSMISNLAKIIIPSFITFLVSRYTLNRPRKYSIAEKQFDLVYLPLYLLTEQLTESNIKQNLPTYIKKVDKLFYKNYPLVYPKTLSLFERLKKASQEEKLNLYHLHNFQYQIQFDYIKLKKILGYPTQSIIKTFTHLNKLDRLLLLCYFILAIMCIGCVAVFFDSLFSGQIIKAISALFVCAILLLMLYTFYYIRR